MMKILIFGASGGTGRQVLTQGLALGHQITAFVRNPTSIHLTDPNLTLLQGNILNSNDVSQAVKGHDVVISVLGNKTKNALWEPSTTISEGVRHILAGMKKHKVARLVFVASFGVNTDIFLPEKFFIRLVLKNIFADIPLQEALIKESNVNWTLVHPSRLVDTPRTGNYSIGEHLWIGPFSKIARADVADFLLKSMNRKEYSGKTITISS